MSTEHELITELGTLNKLIESQQESLCSLMSRRRELGGELKGLQISRFEKEGKIQHLTMAGIERSQRVQPKSSLNPKDFLSALEGMSPAEKQSLISSLMSIDTQEAS